MKKAALINAHNRKSGDTMSKSTVVPENQIKRDEKKKNNCYDFLNNLPVNILQNINAIRSGSSFAIGQISAENVFCS